jgi:Na+-transporting NADH:ubiquinone oxidoreductase subunit NqrB
MTGNGTSASIDARWYQIGALGFLLGYGLLWLKFDLSVLQVCVTLATVFLAQWAFSRIVRLQRVELKSAAISGLSLCLLMRANSHWIVVLAALITIASKFILRWDGRHIFNPTNFGIIALLALAPNAAWVSPGQWGSFAFFAFLMLCLGSIVVNRASRSDVTFAFLFFYVGIVFARSFWLNEPWTIPAHKLENGALLLFAFFMISDPKTTPNSRLARIAFAALVALGAAYVQFKLYRNNGLLWSLALCSPTVPLLNRFLPAGKYERVRKKEGIERPEILTKPRFAYENAIH